MHSTARSGRVLLSLSAILSLMLGAGGAKAQEHQHDSLGQVDFPISCSVAAQSQFNRAMALLHHMTYPQAREAFEQIVSTEPGCAMAHWGVAMTLFQPLWPTRPSPAALRRGWDEVQKAKGVASLSSRERQFIASAEAFYLDPDATDYWLRIRRWEAASEQAYKALPGDSEAAIFFALAHLATTPAASVTRTHADKAAAILLDVYRRQPDHPGVMHYLVHANDVPGREHELLDVTHKYEALAPNNPHALHMPTHIYTRLGDWDGVVKGNLRAADAALLHPAGQNGELVWDEFAHAIEYLVYAYLQQGADDKAEAQLRRLHSTARLEPTFKTAFHLASTRARYVIERRAWKEATAIVPRSPASLDWDRFTWAEATARFARGLGFAHLGDKKEVETTLQRLTELETVARKGGEDLFARNIQVLNLELAAWFAHEQNQSARAVEIMQKAIELELTTPKHAVTPGPTLPALELFGDMRMEQRNPRAALDAYQQSLKVYPRRFNTLLGAARAASESGDAATSRAMYSELIDVAAASTRREVIEEAQRALNAGAK